MKNHIEGVHEGKKKYECSQCDATFKYSNLLKSHVTSVHEGIVFQCPLCDHENFTTKQGLRKHLRLQHGDVEDQEKILANSKVEFIQDSYPS